MIRKCVHACFAPFRWVWRFGVGGSRPIEKLVRRTWLCVFLAIVVGLPLIWLMLLAQFHLVQPANNFKWVGEVNAEAEEIPESDRAWPLYESGFKVLSRTSYATGFDPETGHMYFIRNDDLRGHFEFATDSTRDWNRKVAEANTTAIQRFLEASQKPQLGCIFSRQLEERLDGSLHPLFWPTPRQAHTLRAASEVLRHAFLAAGESGDSRRVVELTAARLRLADHHNQLGPWRFGPAFGNRMLVEIARDVCFFVLQKPTLFTDRDLRSLSAHFRNQTGFASDRKLGEDLIENTLDQFYTAEGVPCGKMISLLQASCNEYSAPGTMRKQLRLLQPTGPLDRAFSFLALPVIVRMMPTREELREQLESQLHEARRIADRQPWEDRADRVARMVARHNALPDWKGLPAFFFRAEFCEVRPRHASLRLATTRLLIALEQSRRSCGEWPESLKGFSDLVPLDPYADQPIQYRVENGNPIIWSVGTDGADDGGKKLRTSAQTAHDWQLVPQRDPSYMKWIRDNQP